MIITLYLVFHFSSIFCIELYPYGIHVGDISIMPNVLQEVLNLSKPILFFSKFEPKLHISVDGIISARPFSIDGKINLPYHDTFIAAYNLDFEMRNSGGNIYFRETFEDRILQNASSDVSRSTQTDFSANQIVVITYDSLPHFLLRSQIQTFQVVLATNGLETYVILKYKRLDSNGAVVGFSERFCAWTQIIDGSESKLLTNSTNIGPPGQYVYVLHSKNCSKVELYPYGPSFGDRQLSRGDNYAEHLKLNDSMMLFSYRESNLYISPNGLISVNSSITTSVGLPYHHTVILSYHTDLDTKQSGEIYYRETSELEILDGINEDVRRLTSSNFQSNQAVIVTYIDVPLRNSTTLKHSFQTVLASDGNVTYGIFNYQRLDSSGALAGFSEPLCAWMEFSQFHNDRLDWSHYLSERSNVGIQGKYVVLLTTEECADRERWLQDVPRSLTLSRKGYDFFEIRWIHDPNLPDVFIRSYPYHYDVIVTSPDEWQSHTFEYMIEVARIEDLRPNKTYDVVLYTVRRGVSFISGQVLQLRIETVPYEPVHQVDVTQLGGQGVLSWMIPATALLHTVPAKILVIHHSSEAHEHEEHAQYLSVCDRQYVFNGSVDSVHDFTLMPLVDGVAGPAENATHTFTQEESASDPTLSITLGVVSSVLVCVLLALFIWYRKIKKKRHNLFLMTRVTTKIDPDRAILEQCNNLPYDMSFEFPRKKVILVRVLGEGAFGQVWMGTATGIESLQPRQKKRKRSMFKKFVSLRRNQKKMVVAVKTLKGNATETEYKDLANELKLLIHIGEHRNIVNLLGACTRSLDLLVLLEYCAKGALLNHLRLNRDDFEATWMRQDDGVMTLYDLTWICVQIADGMDFLEGKKCVHRDLAARNILLTDDMNVKISDFGLARDTDTKSYYKKDSEGLLPIKWMAPEAITDQMYTSKSDVWSYGVLLWEIYTLGSAPYPAMKNADVLSYIRSGRRMNRPKFCPMEIYEVIKQCWSTPVNLRPTFLDMRNALDKILLNEKSSYTGQSMARIYNLAPSKQSSVISDDDTTSTFTFVADEDGVTHTDMISESLEQYDNNLKHVGENGNMFVTSKVISEDGCFEDLYLPLKNDANEEALSEDVICNENNKTAAV